VTFSPDVELSEIVNAPYAAMEMTEIDENEYHEKIEDASDNDEDDDEAEVDEEPEAMEIEKEKPEDKKEEKIENKINKFRYEEEEEPEYNELYDDGDNRTGINKVLFWVFVLIVSGLILFFAGRYFYSKIQTGMERATPDSVTIFSNSVGRQENSDGVKTEVQKTDLATQKAVDTQKKSQAQKPAETKTPTPPAAKPATAPQTQKTESQPAKMNGNNRQHTILKGERLNTIALREYGHKAFWVYIYDENRAVIGNPDIVDPGTVIIIPPAKKYSIDKNNPESVNRALYLEQQYKTR
ncbi:MAG: hypothetical protein LBB73_02450, partial [Dysgonamonadaceae bacterium]|nr:hypothetical protein [Dysgonamonadaceae bacterium]